MLEDSLPLLNPMAVNDCFSLQRRSITGDCNLYTICVFLLGILLYQENTISIFNWYIFTSFFLTHCLSPQFQFSPFIHPFSTTPSLFPSLVDFFIPPPPFLSTPILWSHPHPVDPDPVDPGSTSDFLLEATNREGDYFGRSERHFLSRAFVWARWRWGWGGRMEGWKRMVNDGNGEGGM